jgi:hypothetical protein
MAVPSLRLHVAKQTRHPGGAQKTPRARPGLPPCTVGPTAQSHGSRRQSSSSTKAHSLELCSQHRNPVLQEQVSHSRSLTPAPKQILRIRCGQQASHPLAPCLRPAAPATGPHKLLRTPVKRQDGPLLSHGPAARAQQAKTSEGPLERHAVQIRCPCSLPSSVPAVPRSSARGTGSTMEEDEPPLLDPVQAALPHPTSASGQIRERHGPASAPAQRAAWPS